MKNYLKELSVGEVVDGSVRLYFRHFLTFFVIYLLPLFAVEIVIVALWPTGDPVDGPGMLVVALLRLAAAVPAYGAITVAISDITLGQTPRIARSYGRVFDVIGRFLWTYLLMFIVVGIGFLLLIVPGVIAMVVLMFSMIVVMLERRGGFDALKRSAQLGKGYHLRNFGVLLLMMVLVVVAQLLVGFAVGLLIYAFDDFEQPGIFARLLVIVLGNAVTPIALITGVLLYYDLRVRKENYDTAALAQDLVG